MVSTIYATHIGDAWYQAEASYGAGFAASATYQPSKAITGCTITPQMNIGRLPSLTDPQFQGTIWGQHDYVVKLDYMLQYGDATNLFATALEKYACLRTAGDTQYLAFCLMTKAATGAYFVLKGCKINTYTVNFAVGAPITVSVELWGNNLTPSQTAPTGTAHAARTGAFETFNGATWTRSGKWLSGIKSASLTINNHLERIPKIATTTAQGGDYALIMPGIMETTMTADIIADMAGYTDITELLSGSDKTTIALTTHTGDVYGYVWTLTNPTLNSEPIVYTADMTTMVISADIGAESAISAASS